jgi:hypothetical protein
MNKFSNTLLISLMVMVLFMASCAITSHPNEKMIVGKWKPLSVEKVVDSSALQAAGSMTPAQDKGKTKAGTTPGQAAPETREGGLDRLVQAEMRATLEIFENKTAIKKYPGKPVHATWKMKGNGTKMVGKNIENKMRFVIEILEISKEQVVVIEHLPVGDLKIVYVRAE